MKAIKFRGAIFDLDDTLLDNGPADKPAEWLHSRSRLEAVREIGAAHDIKSLATTTAAENATVFLRATEHSLQGGIWSLLYEKGLVVSQAIDRNDALYPLLEAIAARKNDLHEILLRNDGREVPGASAFIRTLAAAGLHDKLAIASSAIRRDIDIFLETYKLTKFFPAQRIISYEQVSRPKPDPESFELAFQTLHLPNKARREVLAFEDNPRGMVSARAAGLYVCAITTRYNADSPEILAAKPDLVAASYREFSQLLGLN